VKNHLAAPFVQNLPNQVICRAILEPALERNHSVVPNVKNCLPSQEICENIKEFILVKNQFDAPFVQSRLPSQVIGTAIFELTLERNHSVFQIFCAK
jgi:hypothetical protein